MALAVDDRRDVWEEFNHVIIIKEFVWFKCVQEPYMDYEVKKVRNRIIETKGIKIIFFRR